ncbi:hypothetical protein ACOZCG_25945 [Streptomyces pseudogriseolus]|uniref:hypothetical protein n=1 Tax=Streptomyces pseudogriseolus TaxID=36817 RepID=UPI003FA2DB51
MSAVAASAVALPRPRTKFAGEASRRRLRSVPAQAGPAVPPKLGNPLQLGKSMQARLLAAVRALVTSPALAGASDGARLASVVLTAKSNVANDYQASIWAAELGRWLGVSQSTVAHTVLPELRAAGFLGSNVATNSFGHATGLECWVIPMYRAQKAGDRRHPLALSRSELAVLLSLCEVLFGPGWAPKDKAPVPAGLLAGRTGRGAATDRLGLLLMVLTTDSAGWLQLCPGSVDTGRGRPAATVARLLGCTAAAGAKVLKRLQEHGVVEVVRKESGSGLNAQSRVRLVPVAEAHGVAVQEARRVAKALISDLAGTASGDLESSETGEALVMTGIEGAGQGDMAGSADLAVTAQHHASHASGVTPGGSLALSGGFSGEGRGAEGRRPERACMREDQADRAESAPSEAEDSPLRGEKPQESPVNERAGRCAAGAVAGGRLKAVGGGKAQQQRRIGLPADLSLRVALEPVAGLWERLSGWQQDQVEAAVKAEAKRLAGMLERPERAPQLLADRLTDRLEETGGNALVDRPFPWLIRRGLAQRQACSDPRCDDGIRLDTGGECENCNNVLHIRRAQRAKIAAEVDRELPGLGGRERRQVLEERLREHTRREAEQAGARHDRAVAEVEMRRAAAARRQAAEEAAALERWAAACVECGLPGAAGLCPECTYRRCTDDLVQEAVDLAVAVRADLDDPAQIAALSERCEADTRALLDNVCRRQTGTDQGVLAFTAREVAERIRDERRASAHSRLLRSEEADAEAEAVYDTMLRRRPRGHRAAEEAAEEARRRTAHYLLERKLGLLRALRARMQAGRAPKRVG